MTESDLIFIGDLDRGDLLRNLWMAGRRFQLFIFASSVPTIECAIEAAAADFIDYFRGVKIGCSLKGDHADPWLYDRDAGQGIFAHVVERMRQNK